MNFYILISLFSINFFPLGVFTLFALLFIIININLIDKGLIKFLIIPIIIIFIGIINSFHNEIYNIGKDLWYFINPILAFVFGYIYIHKKQDYKVFIRNIILIGIIVSLKHLLELLFQINPYSNFYSVNEIRAIAGTGYYLTLISLILIMMFKNSLSVNKVINYSALSILTLSLFLSFSRTLWIGFIIYILVGFGIIKLSSFKSLTKFILPVAIFFIILQFIPTEMKDFSTIIGKFSYSLEEITIKDYTSKADITNHWRGYESYMAFNTFQEQDVFGKIIGGGFGRLIDLKIYMQLGETYFRYIPILHNGYMYVLVKTGLVGSLLFFLYFFVFFKYSFSHIKMNIKLARIIIATLIYLLFSTLIVSGYFNPDNVTSMFLLGAIVNILNYYNKVL